MYVINNYPPEYHPTILLFDKRNVPSGEIEFLGVIMNEKLSLEDLKDKLQEQQKQLKDLKMNHAVSPLENPLQIKAVRRTVARLLTAITSKENEIIAQ